MRKHSDLRLTASVMRLTPKPDRKNCLSPLFSILDTLDHALNTKSQRSTANAFCVNVQLLILRPNGGLKSLLTHLQGQYTHQRDKQRHNRSLLMCYRKRKKHLADLMIVKVIFLHSDHRAAADAVRLLGVNSAYHSVGVRCPQITTLHQFDLQT